MLAIGDLFLRKSGHGGHLVHPITAIAEDHEGTKLYHIETCGYYTEGQLYNAYNRVTILEEAEEEQCNPEP